MKINPLVVLLFNIVLPISIMFPGNLYQQYFFITFSLFVLVISGKYKRFLKFLLVYFIFLIVSNILRNTSNYLWQFLSMFITIAIQFIPCLVMASILIIDYSSSEIISALEPLRVPKFIVVALVIVIRYIPTFKREFSYIKESMRLRNISYTWKKPLKSFEYFLVPQLFRCSILADEITAAGLSKGITNPIRRTSYYDMKMRIYDYILCMVLLLGTGVIILWR